MREEGEGALTRNDFTIVIPCKNEEVLIGKLLTAIRRQTIYNDQIPILIADAHSTDKTLNIIEEYRQAGMNITVIEGGYPARGRNNGVAACNTRYVVFFDADIVPGNDTMLYDVLTLIRKKDLDCVTAYIKSQDGDWRDSLFWSAHNVILSMYKLIKPFSTGMFVCFKVEAFRRMGGFDERIILGEDYDLSSRVPKSKFGVAKNFIFTTNRRFAKMGYIHTIVMYTRVAFSKRYRLTDHREYFEV